MRQVHSQSGFTLVEVITTVVLLAVLAVFGGMLIITPFTSFTDQTRRAELTDEADNALQRISRELRSALPNSVRINPAGTALEFLHTSTGGRYRAYLESDDGTGTPLINDDHTHTFDVLDGIDPMAIIDDSGPAGQASCFNGTTDCLVIYNTGTGAGFYDAYNGNNIAAITGVTPTSLTYENDPGFRFPFPIPPSSQQRFFVVDMPISYVCSADGRLWRYENYTINNIQPTPANGANIGATPGRLLTDGLSACAFSYNSGAGFRHGLVTLRITVTGVRRAVGGSPVNVNESVSLLYQLHVSNIP